MADIALAIQLKAIIRPLIIRAPDAEHRETPSFNYLASTQASSKVRANVAI